MTTTVTIAAHCADTKEVQVTIMDGELNAESFVMQDGETLDRAVYDGRKISVNEVEK